MSDTIERCKRCDWPVYATTAEGCTRDNCSQRPMPPLPTGVVEVEPHPLVWRGAVADALPLQIGYPLPPLPPQQPCPTCGQLMAVGFSFGHIIAPESPPPTFKHSCPWCDDPRTAALKAELEEMSDAFEDALTLEPNAPAYASRVDRLARLLLARRAPAAAPSTSAGEPRRRALEWLAYIAALDAEGGENSTRAAADDEALWPDHPERADEVRAALRELAAGWRAS